MASNKNTGLKLWYLHAFLCQTHSGRREPILKELPSTLGHRIPEATRIPFKSHLNFGGFFAVELSSQVAKAAFQRNNDPLDAAVFYLAMKKKAVIWGLYR